MDDLLRLLAGETRRRILMLVWDRELGAGQIASSFDVSFGAVSQQLGILLDAELVSVRQEGRHRYYRARKERLGPLASMLEAEWSERLLELKNLAEEEAGHDVD